MRGWGEARRARDLGATHSRAQPCLHMCWQVTVTETRHRPLPLCSRTQPVHLLIAVNIFRNILTRLFALSLSPYQFNHRPTLLTNILELLNFKMCKINAMQGQLDGLRVGEGGKERNLINLGPNWISQLLYSGNYKGEDKQAWHLTRNTYCQGLASIRWLGCLLVPSITSMSSSLPFHVLSPLTVLTPRRSRSIPRSLRSM